MLWPMDDLEQIKQMKARYFRGIDTKDWALVESLFTPDAEIDMTGEGGAVTNSTPGFIERLQHLLAGVITVHHGHMPEITFTSDTTATGIWSMEDKLWWPEGSPITFLHGYGHYFESYAKADGRWWITAMKLTRLKRDLDFA